MDKSIDRDADMEAEAAEDETAVAPPQPLTVTRVKQPIGCYEALVDKLLTPQPDKVPP